MKLAKQQIEKISNAANQIANFVEREEFVIEQSQDRLRICYECGKIIGEGYIINGVENYCSKECIRHAVAKKHIPQDIFEKLNHAGEDGFDENYWTIWNE